MRRVLVSAYGCEPGKGSEQGVGWAWVLQLARFNEVWVITRENNRAEIERALPPAIVDRIHFTYYDLPAALRRLKRGDRGLYLYYAAWQVGALKVARRLARSVTFDFCQHLTFGSLWMPTFLHLLGIPFVWGPVGGGEAVPLRFIGSLPWRARPMEYLRYALVRLVRLNPFFMGPAKAAVAILARTGDSLRLFPATIRHKVEVLLETGVDLHRLESLGAGGACGERPPPDRINVVFSGRLVASKNLALGLEAFAVAAAGRPGLHLTVVGDGPLRGASEARAKALGIGDRVEFLGSLPQGEAIAAMKRSHVFLFPSLREGGTWALIEALAVGLPVICFDGSGMGVITDEGCAIRVPMTQPAEGLRIFAEGLARLADDPGLRARMGAHGRERVRCTFGWDAKGDYLERLFLRLAPNAVNTSSDASC